MSPPPPSLPLVCRPPPPPPPPLSALPPPPLPPLPARRAVKERLGTAGPRAGAARAGAVQASHRPPGRAACAAPSPSPRAQARAGGKVEARGRACGDAEPEHGVTGGLEGGDPACPRRAASAGPTRRPVPAPAARAPQNRALRFSRAARSPSGLCTFWQWGAAPHSPPAFLGQPDDLRPSRARVGRVACVPGKPGKPSPSISRQPGPRGLRGLSAGPGVRCPPTARSVVAEARRPSGPGLSRPGQVSARPRLAPPPSPAFHLPQAGPEGARSPGRRKNWKAFPARVQ